MDWSLFELNSGNYLLRDELGFESRWLYYCAIVLNFILRMSWLLLLLTDKSTTNNLTIGFAIAFGEILRRWQWNFLRVENEHVNNCGQFRAVKEMPLPFQTELIGELHNFDNADVNIDYDRTPSLASWSSWSKKLFPKRKLNPADNWKDFEPTKSTSEYMYGENIFEESDDDSYDEDDDDNVGSRIISMTRMEGGHGLSNAYASRSFLPIIENSS
ncbi:EXS family-domain-containing protein [Glomus cerebriforme]|uniref:EXS family-domain-containing protein n=1 Tax=Glomus cerebriforme TaxID=658196 RepID=A0A397T478_9GLOM|nr:EXS family-domain-containing protein [Glomus cerebriforme]